MKVEMDESRYLVKIFGYVNILRVFFAKYLQITKFMSLIFKSCRPSFPLNYSQAEKVYCKGAL